MCDITIAMAHSIDPSFGPLAGPSVSQSADPLVGPPADPLVGPPADRSVGTLLYIVVPCFVSIFCCVQEQKSRSSVNYEGIVNGFHDVTDSCAVYRNVEFTVPVGPIFNFITGQ